MTQDWGVGLHQRIAGTIRATRKDKGMSAQDLADETVRLGYPISRAQIANYESGRKHGLDVADLLVLAEALKTAPVCLVFPGPYDENVQICPESQELPQLWWAQWFSGLMGVFSDVPYSDGQPIIGIRDTDTGEWTDFAAWGRNLGPLRRAREGLELEERKNALRRSQEGHSDPRIVSRTVDEIADLQRRINEIKADIQRDAEARRRAAENDEETP
jgi:transcriptional regulator with XRE-family HTH domain